MLPFWKEDRIRKGLDAVALRSFRGFWPEDIVVNRGLGFGYIAFILGIYYWDNTGDLLLG